MIFQLMGIPKQKWNENAKNMIRSDKVGADFVVLEVSYSQIIVLISIL